MRDLLNGFLVVSVVVAIGCGGGVPSRLRSDSISPDTQRTPTGSAPQLTMKNYEAIVTGMSYEQVVDVVGFPGERQAKNEVRGIVLEFIVWKSPDGSSIGATFKDGKLANKEQSGLK
jgi:hypothetical protein